MKLLGFLDPKAIVTNLEDCSKEAAVRKLVDAAATTGAFKDSDKEAIVEQVMAREMTGTTGLGGGVALPHVKGTEHVTELCGAFGRSVEGIDFDAVDGQPVHVLFLILSPADARERHIEILRRISEIRENEHYLSSFKRADGADGLARLIGTVGGSS